MTAYRRTPKYRLAVFEDGDVYSARADFERFTAIDNQLDQALKLAGQGVLSGWGVIQTQNQEGTTAVTIQPGFGIIPFTIDKTNPQTGVITKEQHFIGVRTNAPVSIPSLGTNKKNVIYIELNVQILDLLQSNPNTIVDLSEETISIIVRPPDGTPAGSGPFRTTTATDDFGNATDPGTGQSNNEYPIYFRKIDGIAFVPDNSKVVVFINGKEVNSGFELSGTQGNVIAFESPLHPEDNVTVRVDPLNSLVIAEVETDNTKVVDIDNTVKAFAKERSGDAIVSAALITHLHDALENSPEKILLTTKSGKISSASNINNISYTFNKPDENEFAFSFDEGTYTTRVFINGFLNIDQINIVDNGSSITITFPNNLESTDVVTLELVLNNDQTQIKNKLNLSGNNPSAEKIDFEVSGEDITEGTLNPLLLPRLSHIGRYREILKPANDPDSEREYVHRTETFDCIEFFPVHKDKSNARNAKDLFLEQKITSPETPLIHAAASNGFLFQKTDAVMWQNPDNFIGGWSHITLNNDINEYDSPFKIIPIKDPINITTNNWDRLFYIGNRFVNQYQWTDPDNPTLEEIVNFSEDVNVQEHINTITDLRGTKIYDACAGKSPLNMDRTAFILADNQVFFYDYINDQSKYFWLNMTTSSPLWSGQGESLSCIEILGNTILFTGTDTGEVYANILASSEVQSLITAGTTVVQQGNLDFNPNNVWEENSYSYGFGNGVIPDFFDAFNIRGNNFGYGASGAGYGYEEKLPLKSGDNLIFVTANISERRSISSVTDSTITVANNIEGTFNGPSSGLSNSVMLLDWFEIANSLSGTVKKVVYAQNRLILMTTDTVYQSDEISAPVDLFFLESFTFADTGAPSDTFNDIDVVNGILILAGESSIYKGVFNGVSFDWTVSQNVTVATSLNNILFPGYSVIPDGTDVYLLGKYGIFKSTDQGTSWRSSTQIIGLPEDKTSSFTNPKINLKVLATDPDLGRIFAVRADFPYAYGYGYGYGDGADFFDVFGADSSTLGYGTTEFETEFVNDYGYGFGFEVANVIENINVNDWIYFGSNSASIFKTIPLKIINTGIDVFSKYFYIDVELADASKADFTEIVENQNFSVYRKKEALGIIDCIPQDSRYESTDITEYDADYFRQSITFEEEIDPDLEVEIASEYKTFGPIENSILGLDIFETRVNGIKVEIQTRDKEADNFISLNESGNIDDLVRITIKETNITDTGDYTHEELEDEFTLEELGLTYKFDAVRSTNLLLLYKMMQHLYPDFSNETLSEINGTATSVARDYIQDTSLFFAPGALIGRRIVLDSDNKSFDYTIINNDETKIFIGREVTYENFSELANGTKTEFDIEDDGVVGTEDLYKNGNVQLLGTDYTLNITGGVLKGITFTSAPSVNDQIVISYTKVEHDTDYRDIISTGQSYQILSMDQAPFSNLINTFVTMFKDSSSVDLSASFVENSIVLSNENIGKVTQIPFYVHFSGLDDYIYAGTNRGIWKKEKDVSVYCKTGELINTINASGSIDVPLSINGMYAQFNEDSKEWTLTWGFGIEEKDINDNLAKINITALAHNPADTNMILAASSDALYRTEDGGTTWAAIQEFALDPRISGNPTPRQIVFDDKNPWIVNLVNQTGLFRSFDYGNNFEKIINYDGVSRAIDASRSFSYQIDSSDVRGTFYYGENTLQFKNSRSLGPIGQTNPSVSKVRNFDIIGISLGDLIINSINNRPDDVNTVFISSETYGLLKSTVMGNDKRIARNDFINNYVNFTTELINEFSNPNNINFINNTGAFHFVDDPDVAGQIAGGYRFFIDKIKNRTYVVTKIEEQRKVPTRGEFVGKYVTIEGQTYKIIEHYERGTLPSRAGQEDLRGNQIPGQIIEFVLEGTFPFVYNSSTLPLIEDPVGSGSFRNKTVDDYDYYWYGTNFSTAPIINFSNSFGGFKIPLFALNNGRKDKIEIVNGNLWKIGVNAAPEERSSDLIDPTSIDATRTIFTFTKPSVDRHGYAYSFTAGTFDTQVLINELFLPSAITATVADGGGTITVTFSSAIDVADDVAVRLYPINTTTGQRETVIRLQYPLSVSAPSNFLVDDFLVDYFIGDIQSEDRYQIFESKSETLSVEDAALYSSVIALRVDPVENSQFNPNGVDNPLRIWNYLAGNGRTLARGRNSQTAIYHNGVISSSTTNSITFTKGLLPTVATAGHDLTGYVLFPRTGSNASFKIVSNTDNTIVTEASNLNEVAILGDSTRVSYQIISGRVKDVIIDPVDNDLMYISAIDNPYRSLDGGKTFRIINDGLSINSATKETVLKFEQLKLLNSEVYACALDSASGISGGVFVFDGNTWSQIGGISGDGLNTTSINTITVFEESGNTVIYAGTETDGLYKGTNASGSFVWTRQIFPEHNVTALKLKRTSEGDLETIWAGNDGRGFFRKDGINDETWERDLQRLEGNLEIQSAFWRPWNIFEENNEVSVESLFIDTQRVTTSSGTTFDTNSYLQKRYDPIDSKGLETVSSLFDWSFIDEFEDQKDFSQIISIDQSNSTYINELVDKTITDVGGGSFHNLSKYVTGIKGSGRQSELSLSFSGFVGIGSESNILGLEKVPSAGKQTSIYEEPFSHLPDRKSITSIKELPSGRVIIGTDRSGVWRSTSDGTRYILPLQSPDFSESTSYGFDYDVDQLERFRATTESDFPSGVNTALILGVDPDGEFGVVDTGQVFDGAVNSGNKYIAEKIYTYTVIDGTDFFTNLDGIENTVIGGYLVFANDITEADGIIGSRIVLEITNVQEITVSGNRAFKLFLSGGSRSDTFRPFTNLGNSIWSTLDNEIEQNDLGTPTGIFTKIVIIDYESYENISGDLPTTGIKNSRNEEESAVFVRDMDVIGSQAAIACGFGGLYISKDINNINSNNVKWFNVPLPTGVVDVTSVIALKGDSVTGYGYGYGIGSDFFDVIGTDGGLVGYGFDPFEDLYSYSYGYGDGAEFLVDLYIGTWGNGVWAYKGGLWNGDSFTGGTWEQISTGLNHNKVWTLFVSSDNVLYAGTEHGGIYSSAISDSMAWTRHIDNVVRSKIFMWKTEGVPTGRATGFDYTDSDKLLTYSFGGGIMRSLDEGSTWEQVDDGLENFYIQDLAVCADISTDTAYAATAGGGVFKTTDAFSGSCTWTQISTTGLPETLNIDEVEVGYDPNIVLIKARINDLSFKDLPLELKDLADTVQGPFFENGKWTGSLNGSLFNGEKFTPIQPYTKGQRKAILFRSTDGGATWSVAFDRDPNLEDEYSYSSGIFGLTMRPSSDSVAHFLFRSCLTSNSQDIGNIDQYLFVTMQDDQVASEVEFPLDSFRNFKLFNQRSDAAIIVNPNNFNEIYISLHGNLGNNEFIPPIYKTTDGGATWNYATGNFTSSEGFNNKLQLATKTPSAVTTVISEASSVFTIEGPTTDLTKNTATFEEAKQFYNENFNSIVTASFSQNASVDPYLDSLFFTYRDEPVLTRNIRGPRPFYLNGATLRPNINQPTTRTIAGGGNGTFLPKLTKGIRKSTDPQFVTMVLNNTVSATLFDPISNTCRIEGLISLKIDYSSLPSTSIFRKENSLIGLNLTIGSVVAPIAFHRALYSSTDATVPDQIELIIISSSTASFASGTSISVDLERPLYSNFDNDFMMSVNGGISWKKVGKEIFALAVDDIKAAIDNPALPTTTPETARSTYIMRDEGDNSVIYRGDVVDDRYSDGIREKVSWTTVVPASTFKSTNTFENGIAYSESQNAIYVSEKNKISKIDISTSNVTTLFSNINVIVPVSISEADNNRMAFVSDNTITVSDDGFDTNLAFGLPEGIIPTAIRKLVLSKNIEAPDEIFMCVDNGQIFEQASSSVIGVISSGTVNIVTIINTGSTSPFVGFERRFLSFENNDGTTSIFNTRIDEINFNNIYALPTILGSVSSFDYDVLNNRTLLTCNGSSIEITQYIGNSISILSQSVEDSTPIFTGRIEEIDNVTETTFDVIVTGDLRTQFTNNNIDFSINFPFYRVGRVADFVNENFSGRVASSRASNQIIQNGLWFSNTFGEGFIKIDGLEIGGEDDFPGCLDVHVFDDGTTVPVMVRDGINRLMINDKFLPSSNVNRVFALSNGDVACLTSKGLAILNGDEEVSFNSYFFNDFRKILDTGANQFLLFDADDNSYSLNGIPETFYGNESPSLTDLSFNNVNSVFEDNNDAIWIGTEGNGVFVVFNNNTFNFTSVNSPIGSDNVRDITQDSRGNIWLATGNGGVAFGNYGDDVSAIPTIQWINFSTGIGFTSDFGLTGEISAIKERTNLSLFSDGTIETPQILSTWANNSTVFSQSLLLRNTSGVTPNVINGTTLNFTPIRDSVLSIEAAVDENNINVWRITGTLNIDYGTSNLIGKYIIPDSTTNNTDYQIIGNSFNSFDIARDGISEPTVGQFMITDKINDAFVIFTGDPANTGFEFADVNIANDSTYNYYLYAYSSSSLIYKLVDSKAIQVSSTNTFSQSDLEVVCGGTSGLFRFVPGGDTAFSFIKSLGNNNAVTDIFFDTANIGWISAGNKLVEFNAPDLTADFFVEDLFAGKTDNINDDMIVNNAVERADGTIVIGTNVGVSIKNIDVFTSFILNDPERSRRDEVGTLQLGDWRPAELIDSNLSFTNYIQGDSSSELYLTTTDKILFSSNTGASWSQINNGEQNQFFENIKFAHTAKNNDDTIKDFVFFGRRTLSSSGDSNVDFIQTENTPVRASAGNTYTVGNMWLSERDGTTDFRIVAGLYNGNVIEDERELALIDFVSPDEFTTPVTFITGTDGLSIQSTYSFDEIISGSDKIICAGCKDSVIYRKNTDAWKIFEPSEQESGNFVYGSVAARTDLNALEHEKTLYVTRTSLRGNGFNPEVLSLRIDSSVNENVFKYKLATTIPGSTFFSFQNGGFFSFTGISRVDRVAFELYTPQHVQRNTYKGHRGAIAFLEANRTLAVGGFANTLTVIPFTAERSDEIFRFPSGLFSGLRSHRRYERAQTGYASGFYEGFDFPYEVNEDLLFDANLSLTDFSYGQRNKTEANFLTKPKSAWSVEFNGEEGYSSFLHYGTEENNNNKKFDFASEDNISYIMKSRDNGMIWVPAFTDIESNQFPIAAISDYIFDPSDPENIIVSTYNGLFENSVYNSGLFATNDGGKNWTSITDDMPKVPIKEEELINGIVYAGPLGYGVFETDLSDALAFTPDWNAFESRYVTIKGLNLGLWKVKAIDQDIVNNNRILLGTEGQGVLESADGGNTWIFDDNGIPTGNITALKILETNPLIVLAGVENDGLYIRDSFTSKYTKSTTGLPTTSNIRDIKIDNTFSETFNEVTVSNTSNDNMLILRADFTIPDEAPENGTEYVVGNEVGNAIVVYIGTENFATTPFQDRNGVIRSGVPYFYSFYTINNDGTYTERDVINGFSTSIEALKITDTSDERVASPFPTTGNGLAGRIVKPSLSNTLAKNFEIESNTGTELNLIEDNFRIINTGDATLGRVITGEQPYRVFSTVKVTPLTINPIYIVAEDTNTNISKVYKSNDNGRTWVERNDGITSDDVRSLTLEILNVERRLLLPQAVVYAATGDGVFRSEDNAVSWTELSSATGPLNLPNSRAYVKVLVDLENCDNLYSLTEDGEIYRSVDNGVTWESLFTKTTTYNVSDIISFFTNFMFIGTNNFGIIRVDNSIRDKMKVEVIADSNIVSFDIDFLETGDKVTSDINSIVANTIARNDSITDNREQIRFIVDDSGNNLQIIFTRNDSLVDVENIFISNDLINPKTNPFILSIPDGSDDPTVINQIATLADNKIYAATNRGVYSTENFGDKWNRILNAALPEEIISVGLIQDNSELALGTESGLWASSDNQQNFGIVESSGKRVNSIFESTDENIITLFRGGEDGLRVTVENSRSLVVYSGDLSESSALKFSWGDIFTPVDGGWSENTQISISEPIFTVTGPGDTTPDKFDGWDYALIIRKGPFDTFEEALTAGNANDVFAPDTQVIYPTNLANSNAYNSGSSGAEFTTTGLADDERAFLEEIRDANLDGNGALGISFNPKRYMQDGSIVVGTIPNRKRTVSNFEGDFDQGPTPDFPITDSVQPVIDENSRKSLGLNTTNIPSLISDKFYLYRVFPYLLVPDPLSFSTISDQFPTLPRYRPPTGDLPDSYSYNFDIDKFRGATVVLDGIPVGNNNWVVGTDAGVFYSTQAGRDVNETEDGNVIGVNFTVPALVLTSSGIVIAAAIAGDAIYLARSTSLPLGKNWEIITPTITSFANANVKRIYNITEDSNGKIHMSTNAGIFTADANGDNITLAGSVGHLEALNSNKVIGQEFFVE